MVGVVGVVVEGVGHAVPDTVTVLVTVAVTVEVTVTVGLAPDELVEVGGGVPDPLPALDETEK